MENEPEKTEAKQDGGNGDAKQIDAALIPCRIEVLESIGEKLPGKPCPFLSRIAGEAESPVLQVKLCTTACPILVVHPLAEPGVVPVPKVCVFLAILELLGMITNNTGMTGDGRGTSTQALSSSFTGCAARLAFLILSACTSSPIVYDA